MQRLAASPTADLSVEAQLGAERRARALLSRVARLAGAADSERGVLQTALDAVCEGTGWPLGHCYLLAEDGLVHSSGLWCGADDPRFDAFVALTERLPFARGAGLPGRVLDWGRPAWIADVADDPNFPRAAPYLAAGLGAAFAFPVSADDAVLAVLEFFTDHAELPDQALLDVLDSIGALVGHLLLRRRSGRALAASEARFRAVADSASDAVIAVDEDGAVSFWSLAAERMFGRTADEMRGRSLDAIIPDALRPAHHAGLSRVRQTGESKLAGRAVEVPGLRADGSSFPAELTLGVGGDGDGRIITAVIRDCTERREAEARLRAQSDELHRQHEALRRSHTELVDAHRLMGRIFTAYAEILPGTVLDGRYRLDESIGAGGYGVVYRAQHLGLDRPVAVKLFRPASGRVSPEQLRRFQREGVVMCRVRHDNAVAVLDAGVSADGLPFLVMELLVGETLASALTRLSVLPARRAVLLAADLARALGAVHAAGLAHRDVKPENVFLHRADGQEITKLLDFGIVRLLEDSELDARLTETGQVLGTPHYIAPERLTGDLGDERADIFSLGVLLYRALTGRPPFPSPLQVGWNLAMSVGPSPLRGHAPELPEPLDTLLARALAVDPAARPDATLLAEALSMLAPLVPDRPIRAPADVQAHAAPTVTLGTDPTDR